jgi:hypothetical protein
MLDKCPESAEALGMSVLRARCGELTRDYPFGISRDPFESALICGRRVESWRWVSGGSTSGVNPIRGGRGRPAGHQRIAAVSSSASSVRCEQGLDVDRPGGVVVVGGDQVPNQPKTHSNRRCVQ